MATQLSTTELLTEIRQFGINKTVSRHRRTPLSSRTLQELFETSPDPDALLFLASYPNVPSMLLDQLIEQHVPDAPMLAAMAANPRTANSFVMQLVSHPDAEVRQALAENGRLGTHEICQLLQDPAPEVRAALIRNKALSPVHHLPLLAQDADPTVRMAAAQHPKLPEEVLFTLLNDPCALVVAHTILFAKLPDTLLIHLADSDNRLIQALLLERLALSKAIYQSLRLSSHPSIRIQTGKIAGLEDPDQFAWATSDEESDRLSLLDFEELHPLVQKKLASDPSVRVRQKLAAHAHLDLETILRIACSNDVAACMQLAQNPHLPDEAITELCHNEEPGVLKALAYRDDLTLQQLDLLINISQQPDVIQHIAWRRIWYPLTQRELVEKLSTSRSSTVRAFVAASRNMTEPIFNRFCTDPSPQVRLWTALNPLLPIYGIRILSADPVPAIAELVQSRQTDQLTRPDALRSQPY